MKESFERALQEVSRVAKEDLPHRVAMKELDEALRVVEKEKDADLPELIPLISRVETLELQKEKQKIMDWLHVQMEKISHHESVESFSYNTKPYIVNENMEVTLPSGEKEGVSFAELVTDGDWGIEYKLLPEVAWKTKKQYVVAEAKRHLNKLLDRQAGVIELQREIPKRAATRLKLHLERRRESYESVLNRDENKLPGGVIAERMLKTYFEKFQMNNDAPFTFEEARIKADIEWKIDFFLKKLDHIRGVSAEDPTERESLGLQILSATSEEFRQHKQAQLEHSKKDHGLHGLDDIVLVELSLYNTKELYQKWIDEGKKPGGPAKLWSEETEKEVFYGVLGKMFDNEQIDEMWEKRAR